MSRNRLQRMVAAPVIACIAACTLAQGLPPGPMPASPAGASPPALLDADQLSKLKALLAPYRPEALTARDVQALRRALREAGLHPGPALDKAMIELGFSLKRLESLDPSPPQPPEAVASTSGRKVPRRE